MLDSAVQRAVKRSVKKAATWLKTHSIRAIASELKIKQSALKSRFVINSDPKTGEVSIWIGLLAISAHQIGKATQNAAGVRVGRRQYDGAFYQAVYGDEEKVYIRARRNEVMHHDVVRQRRRTRYRALNDPELKGRFPVQTIGVEIEHTADEVVRKYESLVNKRYQEILEHELNYAINRE